MRKGMGVPTLGQKAWEVHTAEGRECNPGSGRCGGSGFGEGADEEDDAVDLGGVEDAGVGGHAGVWGEEAFAGGGGGVEDGFAEVGVVDGDGGAVGERLAGAVEVVP